jgi:hypothetical protein
MNLWSIDPNQANPLPVPQEEGVAIDDSFDGEKV